ncbi:unnamed protein product [Effrenium voratum]|nr:unnamed protein product [Effrenium voratum]CAJ1440883.1 unnamed protein product [Effrenium voratum]
MLGLAASSLAMLALRVLRVVEESRPKFFASTVWLCLSWMPSFGLGLCKCWPPSVGESSDQVQHVSAGFRKLRSSPANKNHAPPGVHDVLDWQHQASIRNPSGLITCCRFTAVATSSWPLRKHCVCTGYSPDWTFVEPSVLRAF